MTSKRMTSFFAAATAAFAAGAANFYVSMSGADHPQYGTGYTDIQSALNAASKGDTVWVEDGFVCDIGIGMDTSFSYGNFNNNYRSVGGCWSNRLHLCKSVTLRSVSGTLDNPVVVKGAFSDPENNVTNGPGSVRCLMVTRTDAADEKMVVKGFAFVGGASTTLGNYRTRPGGGVWMPYDIANKGETAPVFENCRFDGNSAYSSGGGVSGWCYLTNCVVVNNAAPTGSGGGVYGCSCYNTLIATNVANTGAGGYCGNYTKCTIANNRRVGTGGFGSGIYFYEGGSDDYFCRACDIVSNRCDKSYYIGGVGMHFQKTGSRPLLENCTIGYNTGATLGAAACGCRMVDCRIVGNVGKSSIAYGCDMTRCTIVSNTNTVDYKQGALIMADGTRHASKLVNCLVAENAEYDGYNCSGAYVCGDTTLYNCTITDNLWIPKKGSRYAGFQIWKGTLVNTVADCPINDDGSIPSYSGATRSITATNSCFVTGAEAAVDVGRDNVFGDPGLRAASVKGVYEKYAPGPRSICRNAGKTGFDYMSTDDETTKGLDLAGRPRLTDGRVDIGAYQYSTRGLLMLLK